MTDRLTHTIQIASLLGAGLIAGAFLAFSSFIMQAFERLPAGQGIAAMQSINITVINPVFMTVLFGTGLLCAYLGYAALRQGDGLVMAAAALYVLGVLGVTMVLNVPLNNELAALDPAASASADVWARYMSQWTLWNTVRMVASAAACVLLAMTL